MKIFLKTVLLALIATPLFARVSLAEPPGDAAYKKVKRLKERLNLTDKQADSIYSVLKKYDYTQCDDVDSFTKKSECFKEVHASKHAKMKSVLSDAQQSELEEFIVECRENHGPKKSDTAKKKSGEKVSCSAG